MEKIREKRIKQLLKKLTREEKTNEFFFGVTNHYKRTKSNNNLEKLAKTVSDSYDAYMRDMECLERS